MTETTYTAADMRAAWEAGRDAAADEADSEGAFIIADLIRSLTPPTAVLAEGNKPC